MARREGVPEILVQEAKDLLTLYVRLWRPVHPHGVSWVEDISLAQQIEAVRTDATVTLVVPKPCESLPPFYQYALPRSLKEDLNGPMTQFEPPRSIFLRYLIALGGPSPSANWAARPLLALFPPEQLPRVIEASLQSMASPLVQPDLTDEMRLAREAVVKAQELFRLIAAGDVGVPCAARILIAWWVETRQAHGFIGKPPHLYIRLEPDTDYDLVQIALGQAQKSGFLSPSRAAGRPANSEQLGALWDAWRAWYHVHLLGETSPKVAQALNVSKETAARNRSRITKLLRSIPPQISP